MIQESLKVAGCGGCIALAERMNLLSGLIHLLILIILLDLFFIWLRCNRSKIRIMSIRKKLRAKEIE